MSLTPLERLCHRRCHHADCLSGIDSAIGRLKSRGAGRMVVAGMSQGGYAALVYGARHANLAGIIALAPAAAPERQIGLPDVAQSVAQARALVAAGRSDCRQDGQAGRTVYLAAKIAERAAIVREGLDDLLLKRSRFPQAPFGSSPKSKITS